jgi:hypothetical protein
MNSRTFCTIVTSDYLPYAYALNQSILNQNEKSKLQILIADSGSVLNKPKTNFDNITFFDPITIQKSEVAKIIYDKYRYQSMDTFRWCNKPVFINFLLSQNYDKVICVDSDIFFYGDYNFIFEDLDKYSVILSPHWRNSNPMQNPSEFGKIFTEGIYNAGFIAVSQGGQSAMDWWANACAYKCIKDSSQGLYDDQKYLDFLGSKFADIGVLSHQGCNIAEWNRQECRRVKDDHGHLLINGRWEIIFIHFTSHTIKGILLEDDDILEEYLREYLRVLRKYKPESLDMASLRKNLEMQRIQAKQVAAERQRDNQARAKNLLKSLRCRLRLKTRLLKFIQG